MVAPIQLRLLADLGPEALKGGREVHQHSETSWVAAPPEVPQRDTVLPELGEGYRCCTSCARSRSVRTYREHV